MSQPKTVFARLRIELLSARYDFWLERYGTKRSERHSLRRELIANMISASHELGYSQARRNLGFIRALAHAQAQPHLKRPSAERGFMFSALAFSFLFLLSVFSNIFLINVLADLQAAAEVADPVSASSLFGTVTVGTKELALSGSFDLFGWQSFTLLLAFITGSRPWLLLQRSQASGAARTRLTEH